MSHSPWELDAHVGVAAGSDRDADIDAIVSRAAGAQESFANWTDARVDSLLRDLANAFAAKAEELAGVVFAVVPITSPAETAIFRGAHRAEDATH